MKSASFSQSLHIANKLPVLLFIGLIVGCQISQLRAAEPPRAEIATGQKGMVVCVSPAAAEVGVEILRRGGNGVPNTVLDVIVNTVDYKMPLPDAISAPRSHHQWFPDRLDLEDFPGFDSLSTSLQRRGHNVRKIRTGQYRGQGDAHSIAIDPATGVRTGIADKRRDGSVLPE